MCSLIRLHETHQLIKRPNKLDEQRSVGSERQGRGPTTPRAIAFPYPLFVVIPKDDVIPKFSFSSIFTGNFSDLEL